MRAANAVHEYPVLKDRNGQFQVFKDSHGLVIGGMEDVKYREYEVHLNPGSKMFVYTDGVTEATNSQYELFGVGRMVDALNEQEEATPQQILDNVSHAVDAFVNNAEQFDDLTMLCMEYNGPCERR